MLELPPANQRAMPIPLGRRAARLKWGIVVAAVGGSLLWRFFSVIWGGEVRLYDGTLALSRLCLLEFVTGFIGGAIAGSATRSGLGQGLFCGFGIAGWRVTWGLVATGKAPTLIAGGKLALSWKLAHSIGLLALPGAILGGVFGQYALPAAMIARGKRAEKSDDFRYVGSPAPNRTVALPDRVS